MKDPKRILITGASSGIGRALALEYAAPGIFLALNGRDAARLSAAADACREKGAAVETGVMDVTDREALAAWIKKCSAEKPLDLVIANAGISGGTGGVMQGEPMAQVREIFAINLDGVLNTVEAVLPFMLQEKKGQIALMSSLASFRGWPGAPAYSASKGAVRFYGESLRGSLKGSGVEVNVICPGFIRTPMTDANPYPMPFMMDAARAAIIIRKGLSKNKGRIAFPWPTFLLAGFAGLLPDCFAQPLLSRLPSKPRQ